MRIVKKRKKKVKVLFKNLKERFLKPFKKTKIQKIQEKIITITKVKKPEKRMKYMHKLWKKYSSKDLMEACSLHPDREIRLELYSFVEHGKTMWDSSVKMKIPKLNGGNIYKVSEYLKSSKVTGKGSQNIIGICDVLIKEDGRLRIEDHRVKRRLDNAIAKEDFIRKIQEELQNKWGITLDFENRTIEYEDEKAE